MSKLRINVKSCMERFSLQHFQLHCVRLLPLRFFLQEKLFDLGCHDYVALFLFFIEIDKVFHDRTIFLRKTITDKRRVREGTINLG